MNQRAAGRLRDDRARIPLGFEKQQELDRSEALARCEAIRTLTSSSREGKALRA